ncbi:hypothetical protein K439DRAFT_1372369 [Ramaria rubella]|nr:hypothetical protein K439DRAFT_1372369 [Ramaria rubella]
MSEKSLPSLPKGSVTQSASARSGAKTESFRGSVDKSESSRHSVAKSEASIRSAPEPESTRHVTAGAINYSFTLSKSAHDSIASESVIFIPPSPPRKSLRSRASSSSSTSSLPPKPPLSSSSSSASSISRLRSERSTSSQNTIRTFDDIVDEVATSLALRAKMTAETVETSDRTRIGVCTTMSRMDNARFMRILAAKIHHAMTLQASYLFALIPSVVGGPLEAPAILVFCGSPQHLVTKASILAGLRFKTRLAELEDSEGTWVGYLDAHPVGRESWDLHMHDEDILWDIVRKAANPVDSAEPPPGSRGIDQLLREARTRLDRLSPREAFNEAVEDGILVDIRPEAQRAEHGSIPGAVIIERNVLEWRFDPRSFDGKLPIADRYDLRVIIYCQEGYTSSLAAASLQDIGLWRATDIHGGFARWKSEGLPTIHDVRHSMDGIHPLTH